MDDPTAFWAHIVGLAEGISETAEDDGPDAIDPDDAAELADHIMELKNHIAGGGDLPDFNAET